MMPFQDVDSNVVFVHVSAAGSVCTNSQSLCGMDDRALPAGGDGLNQGELGLGLGAVGRE